MTIHAIHMQKSSQRPNSQVGRQQRKAGIREKYEKKNWNTLKAQNMINLVCVLRKYWARDLSSQQQVMFEHPRAWSFFPQRNLREVARRRKHEEDSWFSNVLKIGKDCGTIPSL